jgi:hypothetical protein
MTIRKAKDLAVGDVFRLHVFGEVLEASPVPDRKVKIKIALENQGRRSNRGALGRHPDKQSPLEFLDSGYVLEFVCRASRTFRLHEWWDDDDDDDEDFVVGPPPETIDA